MEVYIPENGVARNAMGKVFEKTLMDQLTKEHGKMINIMEKENCNTLEEVYIPEHSATAWPMGSVYGTPLTVVHIKVCGNSTFIKAREQKLGQMEHLL